jgi:hypothetical protein
MATEARSVSIEPTHRHSLAEISWEEIAEAGAYVEKGSGDLYRVPQEGLLKGCSPSILRESATARPLVRLSGNPYVTTLLARMLCAKHNIKPNF